LFVYDRLCLVAAFVDKFNSESDKAIVLVVGKVTGVCAVSPSSVRNSASVKNTTFAMGSNFATIRVPNHLRNGCLVAIRAESERLILGDDPWIVKGIEVARRHLTAVDCEQEILLAPVESPPIGYGAVVNDQSTHARRAWGSELPYSHCCGPRSILASTFDAISVPDSWEFIARIGNDQNGRIDFKLA
jgi:hypothetical protein